MRASRDRQDATKDAALRTTLSALAADGRAALEARDAAEDARARAEHEKTRAEEKYQRAEDMLRHGRSATRTREFQKWSAPARTASGLHEMRSGRSAAGAAAAREVVELRRLLDEERLIRRDEAWRAAGEERLRQRRLVAVATAMRRAHGRWRRERLQEALAVWIEDITITARVAAIAQRVALRVHGAPPSWWTPAVENAARQLARRVDAAEAAAAASWPRRARRGGDAPGAALRRRCAARRAEKCRARITALRGRGDGRRGGACKGGPRRAAAIAASDAEVTLFEAPSAARLKEGRRRSRSPPGRPPRLVATGALDAAGRAELEAWCLLTGRALEQGARAAGGRKISESRPRRTRPGPCGRRTPRPSRPSTGRGARGACSTGRRRGR